MVLKRAVGLGLLAVASLALAKSDVERAPMPEVKPAARPLATPAASGAQAGRAARSRPAHIEQLAERLPELLAQREELRDKLVAAQGGRPGELQKRRPVQKLSSQQIAVPPGSTGERVVVKFWDRDLVSIQPDGTLVSESGADLEPVRRIIEDHGLTVSPSIKLSKVSLQAIQDKAAAISLKEQPVLSGMVNFEREGGVPIAAARALNDLAEFAAYEPKWEIKFQAPAGGTVACCVSNYECFDVSAAECNTLGGNPWNTTCSANEQCGACCTNDGDDCADNVPPNACLAMNGELVEATPCEDEDGETACDIDCGDDGTGSCIAPHSAPFCSDEECCSRICVVDPFCCDQEEWTGRGVERWDEWCVDHALELCLGWPFGGPGPAPPSFQDSPTPNFTAGQGYLTPRGYFEDNGIIPPVISTALRYQYLPQEDGSVIGYPFILDGYTGEGYNLQYMWDVAEFLKDNGIGEVNRSRGLGTRVGVIEQAAFLPNAIGPHAPYGHEELMGKAVSEDDQTIIILPHDPSPASHGTSTLGIIGALDNRSDGTIRSPGASPTESRQDQRGIVGMAPECDLYFFPDVSAEEGGRLLSAIGNALEIFGPGDVLSFSIGPSGCGTLASNPATWTLLRLAADLGVTCVISAGNDCCDLQDSPQFGGLDSGAIIVGATYPGCDGADGLVIDPTPHNCFCRIYFSNYCTACGVADAVHIGGWGDAVMTIGCTAAFDNACLDVFVGSSNNPWNRSYTNSFGGTSAAAPMVASLVAGLQGIAKQFYGIPLMPDVMRSLVAGGDWVNQCAPLADPPGSVPPPAGGSCPPGNHSWSDWNQGAGSNRIGWNNSNSLTNAFAAATDVITGDWFDGNGLLTGEIEILRGTHIHGNSFSIRSPDDNYLVLRSQYTEPGSKASSSLPHDPVYTGYGHITDVLVHAQADIANVNALVVRVESYVDGGTGIMLVEMYDWIANLWSFTGFGLIGPPDPDAVFEFPVALEPHRFVRESDDRIVIRVWTLAVGGFGGIGGVPGDEYRVYHDWIWIDVGESFADIEDPP